MAVSNSFVSEIEALSQVLSALENLDDDQRKFVIRTAAERLGLALFPKDSNAAAAQALTKADVVLASDAEAALADVSPKAFIQAKDPDSDVLRATCLAYYLTYARNKPHFTPEDIVALNTEAACPNFGNPHKTVNNATGRSGLLAPAGGGKKQIAAHGENVVNALPDHKRVNAVLASYGKKKHAKAKPKRTKVPA